MSSSDLHRHQSSDAEPDIWFYLSFADGSRTTGEQFLGGTYVRGATLEAALTRSHVLGINPGGEVQSIGPIPEEALAENVSPSDWERLLTREELGR